MSQKQMKPKQELVEDVITSSDKDGFTIWYGGIPMNFTTQRAAILYAKLNFYFQKLEFDYYLKELKIENPDKT